MTISTLGRGNGHLGKSVGRGEGIGARYIPSLGFLILCVIHSAAVAASARSESKIGETNKRPVAVSDSIQMTNAGDVDTFWGPPLASQLAHYSPDGKRVMMIIRRGNLNENTNEYSLLLWRTADLLQSPQTNIIVKMSSSSNRPAIEALQWLGDSERISFLGENPKELHQLYVYDIRTRTLRRITNHPTNVISYSITPNGSSVAYIAEDHSRSIWDEKGRREGILVSTQPLINLLSGQAPGEDELFFQPAGKAARRIRIASEIRQRDPSVSISPNADYIVLPVLVRDVPEIWKEYSDGEMNRVVAQVLRPGESSELREYELIKTSTGKGQIVLGSPLCPTRPQGVAWSPDGQSLVLSNIYLPLEGVDATERAARQSSPSTVALRISVGGFTKITSDDLLLDGWDVETSLLHFEDFTCVAAIQCQRDVFFSWSGLDWATHSSPEAKETSPKIFLEEDVNTPPRVFAVDTVKHEKAILLDLNPQFKSLIFGKVEEIHWKGSDGHDVSGGLYYPVHYVPGKKYPLVIQTHGWVPKVFWIDGAFKTAFAAQALAGKDIMVLQADEGFSDPETQQEVEREVATFEGAIEFLQKKALVDPEKIGIIGFSRTCLFVEYALTHSKYHFAAAALTDGVDGGYFQYTAFLNASPGWAQDFEGVNGGIPSGDGLKSWMERSPSFGIEKVHIPVRITALNPTSTLLEWEWFVMLQRLDRPVEMILIQDGAHILEKPWDRMISQQGNVDWFAFWLKNEQDPDPQKAPEYFRWKEFRNRMALGQ
jgi:dipeptidyl aminopeptidase/acylaminoacyl peptidase